MEENVFINYRRQTDAGIAGRIYDALSRELTGIAIFMDVDKLAPGDDFEESLQRTLASCRVFLPIIGAQWAQATDASGKRRLDDPEDFVRKELRTALDGGVRVIPVLIGDARMPTAAELPADLRPLAKRQAMEIRHERFNADVEALAQAITASAPGSRRKRWPSATAAAAAVGLALLAGMGFHYWQGRTAPTKDFIAGKPDHAWTKWLSQSDYQRVFDAQISRQRYPSKIEANAQGAEVRFRGYFVAFPAADFAFYSRHSVGDAEFDQFDADMKKRGFKQAFHQRIEVEKRGFNQGTWTKP